jgi:hypothetical protein
MRKVEKNEGEEKEGLRKRTWIRRRIIYRLRKKRELVKTKKKYGVKTSRMRGKRDGGELQEIM